MKWAELACSPAISDVPRRSQNRRGVDCRGANWERFTRPQRAVMARMRALQLLLAVAALLLLRAVPAYSSQGGDILALAIDPLTPTTLYAAMDGGGLFKTTDGGASWNATGLTNISVLALAIDPLTPTTLYAGVYGGPVKSADGGASWSATGLTAIDVYSVAIDPLTPTTLYAGTNGAVHKSTDSGASWNATGSLLDYPRWWTNNPAFARVSSVAIDFVTPTTLYAAINVLSAGWYGSPTGGQYHLRRAAASHLRGSADALLYLEQARWLRRFRSVHDYADQDRLTLRRRWQSQEAIESPRQYAPQDEPDAGSA